MTLSILFIYAIASFSVIIIPGPTMLLALTNGTTRNKKIVMAGILGAVMADLLLMIIVFLGLGTLLIASEMLFNLVKWLGVGYLVFLSVQLLLSNNQLKKITVVADKQLTKAFSRALFVAIFNPKALLFYSAFFPQFINISIPQIPQYIVLAIITVIINMLIMTCYALGGFHAARLLANNGLKRMNQACAFIMLSLAIFLALYRKSN